ncbi:MAG: tandem-95 repeat protein [Candidatus Cloacimonetes bacterium]|nr:tandem-95 repeat protein [Candidatus Cloacimonadota bacterium]
MNRKISNFQAILLIVTLLLTFKIFAIEVTGEEPDNGSTVTPNSQVYFEIISDIDTTDVVLSTVSIILDGVEYAYNDYPVVQYSSLGNYAGQSYSFLIDPVVNFDYGDSINVEVNAYDNHGVFLEHNWYFYIQQDNIAPFLSYFSPGTGVHEVDPGTSISFQISDGVSGIDDQSLQVHIQTTTSGLDETYSPGAVLDIYGDEYHYTCELSWAEEHFVITDTVSVGIQVNDYAGNQRIFSYTFYIQSNYNYTYVMGRTPRNNATNVDVNTTVEFDIFNGLEGVYVDTTTIQVQILNDPYNFQQVGHFEFEPISPGGENAGYHVTILPYGPFEYDQLVTIEIDAEDTSGEPMATDYYSFRTVADHTAPSVSGWNPYPNEDDVVMDTDIYFEIRDGLSGVNIDSVKVFVDSLEFNTLSINNFEYIEIDNGYGVTVTPLEPFISEQTVEILIRGEDNLGNEMAVNQNTHYYFTTEVVSQNELAPFLLDIYPEDGEQNLQLDTEISFRVYDADPGINAGSIRLRINNQQVEAVVEPDSAFGMTEQYYWVAYRVTYQLNETTAGTINWQVQVEDMIGNTYNEDWEEAFNFTVTASLPPYINLPAQFIFLEDNDYEIDFRDYAGDPDGGFPELSVIGANNINVDINGYMVTLSTAADNWNGQETLTFTVDDGIGTPVSDNVLVRVIAVNDPPEINLPAEGFTFAEDSSNWVDFDQYVSDVDAGDQLLLQASGNTNVLIAFNGLDVNISSTPDWNGFESITFTVFDSGQRTGTPQTVPVTFEPSPDLPVLNLPNIIILAEDGEEEIDFTQYIYDPEGLELQLVADANNNINIDIQGTMVTLTPDANYTGDSELTFRIRYTGQTWVEDNTTVRVLPINDPPVFTLPAQVALDEDSLLVLDFSQYISDVDNDISEISLGYYGAVHIAVQIDSMTVTLTPAGNWNGSEGIYFVAQDIGGAAITRQLTVNVNPMNDAPVINFPPYIEFAEDTEGVFNFGTYITDIDGDDLVIAISDNDSISYNLDGMTISFSAPENWFGSEVMEFAVNDGMGGSAVADLQVRVYSVNDTPIMNLPESISFDEDEELIIDFADSLWVIDLDGDTIEILPSGNSDINTNYNGSTVVFSADANWNGSEEITFHAFDGHSGVVFSEMTVIVNPVNDPPTINLPRDFNMEENDDNFEIDMMAYIIDVDLYDYPNPDELTIECDGSEHITVEIEDMDVVIIPDPDWIGTEVLTFTVEDEGGESATDNVNVVVTSWQNNHQPEINQIPTLYFDEDQGITINFVDSLWVTDSDGDDLIITIFDNQLVEAAGSGEGSVISFSAGENVNGSEEVSILVDDQHEGYAQGTMYIVITPVDDILQFDLPTNFEFEEDNNRIEDLNQYIIDVDDDFLSLEFEGNENIYIQIVGPMTVIMQAIGTWMGSEMVTFIANDGITAVSDSVNIIVNQGSGNHAPEFINLPESFTFDEDTQFEFDFTNHILDLDTEPPADEHLLMVTDLYNALHIQITGLNVTLWADANWEGEDQLVTFWVYDTAPGGSRAYDTAIIPIIVNAVNDAPWISLPESYFFEENDDLTVDLSAYYGDVDGTTPFLSGTNGEHITAVITAPWVTFTAEDGWVGTDTLSFTVNDGFETATDSIIVNVTQGTENNPPVIAEDFPDSVGFNEDTSYQLDFNNYVTDEDGDDWMVGFNTSQYIGTTVNGNVVTFIPAANWNGTRTLHFTIYELLSRDQVTGQISITVYPINDAPVININQDIIIEENDDPNWDFSPFISDIDSYSLTLTATGNDTIYIEITGDVVHFDPLDNWYGVETVTFTVSDGILNDSQLVNVVVEQGAFNHPPEINLPDPITLDEDIDLVMDFAPYLYDADGDELALNVEYNESVVATIEGLVVTFRPSLNWSGEVNLEFTVYDSEPGNRSSATQDVQIVVNSVNDAPELDLPGSWEFADNGSLTENFRNYSFDADGDLLTITWNGNENINIIRDGYLITFSTTMGWYGNELIYFHATDEGTPELTATDSVLVTVTLGANNHPPQLTLPDTLSLQEDIVTEFNFGPYMNDEDGDDLIITAGYNPNIAFSVTDSLVTLIPAANYFGSQLMTFTVYDSQGGRAAASQDVMINVMPVNDPPTIDLPASITFSNSEPYNLNFSSFIEDVDGETVTLTAEGDIGISVEIFDYQVRFEVEDEFSGSEDITFTVTDSNNETDSDVVQVTAVSGNVNTPPVITLPEEFSFEEDGNLVIDFEGEGYIDDIDDDPLSLLVYGNENILVAIDGTEVTLTATPDWYGDEDLAFYVFDDMGRETASDEVNVVVTPVNDAPLINLPPELSYVEGEWLNNQQFSNYISDVDAGDDLTLSVTGNVNIEVSINHLGNNIILVSFHSELGFSDTETLTFTVTDQDSLFATDNINIIVEGGDWNHAPEFTVEMPTTVSIKEDTIWEADFTAFVEDDDDDDEIVLTVGNVDNIDVEIDELDVTITPDANWYGSRTITFIAYDTVARASAQASMTFTVRPQNDAPVINLPGYISFVENDILRVNFINYIQDIDGDALTISWEGNENINVDPGPGYNIDFSNEDGFYGMEDITFRVEDDSSAIATDIVSMEVLQGQWNHPPTIELPDQLVIDEDTPQQFDFGQYIDDIDVNNLLIITCDYNEDITVSIIEDTLVYLIPDENYNGSTTLHFHVIDNVIDEREVASDDVVIIVNPVNDAPTLELPEQFSMTQEDVLFESFSFFMEDVDGDALLLTGGEASHLNITIQPGFWVTIDPIDEIWSGEEEIFFTVTDPDSLSATDSMIIRVYQGSSNTPPEINLPDTFTFREDEELVIDFFAEGYVSDEDENDELFISVTGNHDVIVEIQGFEVTISAESDWNGSEEMLFYVFDDMTGRSTASDDVEVIVTPVNDAPVIDLPPQFERSEDDFTQQFISINLDQYIDDIDSPFYSLEVSGQEHLEINVLDGTFTILISLLEQWTGTDTITFTVEDDSLASSFDIANITITPGEDNHPPTIELPDSFDLVEDQQNALFNFSNYVGDVDGDDIVITTGNYTYLEIDIDQLYVTITPAPDWFGMQRVDFVVWDTQGRASATDFVNVIVAPVNDVPVMTLPDSIVFEENSQIEVNFAPYLQDVDGDQLTISWEATDSIDVDVFNYRVSFQAYEDDWYGNEMITFNAADDSSSVTDSVLVVIERGNWNHAPELALPDGWTVAEDEQLVLDFTQWASDEDGDDLRLFYTYNPLVAMSMNGMEEVTLIPAANYFGDVTLYFSLIDNVSRIEVYDSAILTVTPVNDAPTISLPDDFSFVQTEELYKNFNHYMEDIDNETLTLSCIGNINISVDLTEQPIVHFYLEDEEWSGTETITFTVSDDSLSASDDVIVRVIQGSTNTPPGIQLPASLSFEEDMNLQRDFEAEGWVWDDDLNDELSITVSENEDINVEIIGTLVILSATANWYGTELLTFWVIDEQGQAASDEVPVIVNSVNDAPAINLPSQLSFEELSSGSEILGSLVLSDYVSDVDDNSGFTWEYGDADNIEVAIVPYGEVNITYVAEFTCEVGWTGRDTLSFTVYDDSGDSGSDSIIINVNSGDWNHAPEIYLPETVSFLEDESYIFDLTEFMHDLDGDYIIVLPEESPHINISIDPDTIVTLSATANWNGIETISFTVHDSDTGSRLSAYGEIEVTVESVNDLPVMNLPALIEFDENTTEILDFNLFVSDADQEVLQLDYTGNDTILVSKVGYTVFLSAPVDWTGEEWITFTVTDSVASVIDSTLVRVLMGDWNHAPEMALPEEGFTLAEDTTLQVDFDLYTSDDDGDILLITSVQDPDIMVSIAGSMVTFNPVANYNGTKTLTFEVIDNLGAGRLTATGQVDVIVTPVNDPPTLTLPSDIGISVDIPRYQTFNSFIHDIDGGDTHTITYSVNDNIQISIDELLVTFLSNWVGSEMITFTVSDQNNATAIDSMEVVVYAGIANNAPEINLPDLIIFNEDGTLQVDFNQYLFDPDYNDLSLLVTGNSMITANIQPNELVNFSAVPNWSGTERLTFLVSDNITFASDYVDVQVLPVNDTPTLDLPDQLAFTENTILDIPFYLYMADVDGDNLNINYSGNDNIVIEVISTTVRLSCSGWFGTEDVIFTVDDGFVESIPDTISIEVRQGVNNHPPEIDMPENLTTDEDEVLTIDMTQYVSDDDGDQMIIVVNNAIHTDITTYGYYVYVNPEDNWNGTETLTFIVYDSARRDFASDVVNIIVTPVNDDPVINLPQAGFNFNENGSLIRDFNQYIDDVDNNDTLTLQCSGNQNILVDIDMLGVIFDALEYWSGMETLTFTVNDGNGGSAIDEINVTVNFVNDPPYVIAPIQNFLMQEDIPDTSINLNNVFADHDLVYGDELVYSWFGDINVTLTVEDGSVTISPDLNWNGNQTLTFRATDSEGLFVEDDVLITVDPVNDLPVVITEGSITAQADTSGFANVWLSANGSYDIDGEILSVHWSWDENGGGSVEGMVVQQAFTPGYYVITVEATDNQTGVGTATTYLSVADYNNQSPIAMDDYYSVYETEDLIVHAANGVLSNDLDPDNGPDDLTAVLVNGPAEGTFNFSANGSFTFVAENITNHNVTFTYQAYDGQAYSLIRTVNITVHEIVLEDAEISINSIDTGGETGVSINVPILTSELIEDWDVRSFEFDLQFTDGVVLYTGYNFADVIIDSLGSFTLEQSRGNLHCTYSSTDVITDAGALVNIEFFYYLGQTPLEITNFYFNDTAIEHFLRGAVNNHYPQLSNPITILEDIYEDFDPITINLDEHFTDLDDDELSYSVVCDEEIIAVISGNILELNSVPNQFGNPDVTITATDGYTLTQPVVYTFNPNILPVNDAPEIDLPDFITFPEDSSLVVNMVDYVSDPDFDVLSFSWSASDNINISINLMQLTFSSNPDWNGTEMLTIEVSDGVTGRLIASDSLDVIVTPVNDPPVLDLPISFSIDEDESEMINFLDEGYLSDPEDDTIILSVSGNTDIIIDIVNTLVTISAPANWNGNEDVMFYAQDDQGSEIDSMGVQIIISPREDAPVIQVPGRFYIDENSTAEDNTFNFADSLWIYDDDGDILELIVDDGEFINIVIEGSIVTFEPQENFVGVENRVFSVSDDEGATWHNGAMEIRVLETQGNRPPEIILPPGGFTYAEDSQLVINFADSLTAGFVSDPDDDDVLIIVYGTSNITARVDGLFLTLGTTANFFGTDEVVIEAADTISRESMIDTFLVNITPVNDPPEINLPENIVMLGDTTRVINMGQYLSDIDNDVNDLTLEVTGNIHVGVEIFNTVISFTSPAVWEGGETLYFSVIDNGTIPAQDSLVVIVEQEAINHRPEINLPANFTFDEDDELQVDFTPYVSDQDEDEIFISASGYENLIITISELLVTLSAEDDWNGSEAVTFTVYDSSTRLSDSDDIQINVTAVNDPPRFSPIYDFIMEYDQTLEVDFANYVSDLEGDSFSLSLSTGVGINVTQAGTKFTIVPEADCPEMQQLTLTATENTSGIFSEAPFGLFVKAPAIDLAAITDAVNSGLFTFYENSGEHTIDFAQFLQSSYDITLASPYAAQQTSDSLTVSIEDYDVTFTPQSSWIGTVYVPFTITYLYDRARRDFEIKITVRATKSGENVVPLPHTVTGNQDCYLRIDTGEASSDISGKILNRRGKLIKEFSSEPQRIGANRYIYLWDKKDMDDNPVYGGLYIYQVDVSGKIYQGTIIIVR